MTKEEIIEVFEKETGRVWFTSPESDYVEWLELKLQSENKRLKAEREWIKIDDILNVPAGKLIMLSTDKWITTGFRYHLYFEADNTNGVRIYPTHWMPLPQTP